MLTRYTSIESPASIRAMGQTLRAIVARAVIAIALLCFAVVPAFAARRVALVIGNSAYRHAGTLPNTANDARAMAALFKKAGFDVVDLRLDLGVLEFKRTVRGFMNEAKQADIAVVYYAGHGIEAGGTNYLIPVDAKLATDYDADDETVSLDRIILALQPARQLRLIILDACRENPFLNKIQRTVSARGLNPGLGKVDPATPDMLIAYAAKAGSISYDGNGPNSPFTTALLKHIAEPGLDIRIAFGRIRDEVLRDTNGEQEPFVYGSLGGTTISLVPATEAPNEQQSRNANADIQRDYELAERVGTRQAWTSFLAVHGSGFYADLARAQLAKLSPAASEINKPTDKQGAGLPAPAPRQEETRAPSAEPLSPAEACRREANELRRLRAKPDPVEAQRLAQALTCDSLRSQLARLLESINPALLEGNNLPTALQRPRDGDQAARATPGTGAHEAPAAPSAGSAAERNPDESSCKRDEERLVKLRANPLPDDVRRFAHDLHCEALRAQVVRLLESVGVGD